MANIVEKSWMGGERVVSGPLVGTSAKPLAEPSKPSRHREPAAPSHQLIASDALRQVRILLQLLLVLFEDSLLVFGQWHRPYLGAVPQL